MATALSDRKPVVVVAVGGANTGKTTALNNIFSTDFPTTKTRYSEVREVHRDGRSYILIDTPGFQNMSNNERVQECITDALRGLDFTLLLCLPITSAALVNENTIFILINLQKCLHNRIWEKCVLLLTFSDDLRNEVNDAGQYKDSIRKFVTSFKRSLNITLNIHFSVNTIFDYKDDYTRQYCGYSGIVALPVRKENDTRIQYSQNYNRNPDIIPGISLKESWVSCLFNEINTKIAPLDGKLKTANFKSVDITPELLQPAGLAASIGASLAVWIFFCLFTLFTDTGPYASYQKWISVRPEDQIRRLREKIHRDKTS